MSKKTTMQNLPPHLLKRIDKLALNLVPFVYKLNPNGSLQRSPRRHNFAKNREYGTYVRPLSSIMEVHPNIRTKLKQKPSRAYPLRAKLPQEVVNYINVLSYQKSTMRLPYTHYASQSKRGGGYHSPHKDPKKNIKWLSKSEYIPVVHDKKSGLFKKVPDSKVKNTQNVKFVTKAKLKGMPTNF